MADFLIKNIDHWMDKLTHDEVQEKINNEKALSIIAQIDPPISKFEQSYNTRYQKGDVIEVGNNNHWADTQHSGGKFLIIRVPFIPLSQAIAYMGEWEGVHRRRYRMWFETITVDQMKSYEIAPYVYQLNTVDELLLFGQDKVDE